MEWGLPGATAVGAGADYAVIVDVLSFSTSVSVAVDRHAEVYPYPWRDDSARDFARRHRATLAAGRSEAAPDDIHREQPSTIERPQISLSPASIRAAARLDRIVLPSPNGSALASALAHANDRIRILAACLRNRTAVATWLASQPSPREGPTTIAIVAAGERWPDDSLRPAAEDLWGAGAVIAALDSLGVTGLSPEARSAAAAWRAIEPDLGSALASCSSGVELAGTGFGADVAIAGELDTSTSVSLLTDGRFIDAA
jgi:2-phosphosulfolactate phosphatase